MNDIDTRNELLSAARELFARRGFKGTTIRAITSRAESNLGAVTYHFGTKEALYHSVLEDAVAPIRELISRIQLDGSTAIDQIENSIRAIFQLLRANPATPRLMLQALSADDPIPEPILVALRQNLTRMTRLVAAGQEDGSVRDGTPMLMALSFAGLPIFFGIYRKALQESVGLDQADAGTSADLVDTVVAFIRAGLSSQ